MLKEIADTLKDVPGIFELVMQGRLLKKINDGMSDIANGIGKNNPVTPGNYIISRPLVEKLPLASGFNPAAIHRLEGYQALKRVCDQRHQRIQISPVNRHIQISISCPKI